jgi:heavy metal translocating P-type ATPase
MKCIVLIILSLLTFVLVNSLSLSTAISSIKPSSEHIENGIIKVNGMKCTGCVNSVKSTLLKLNGVYGADVSLLGSYCNIEYNNQIISVNDIYDHLSKTLSFKFSLPKSNKIINIIRENVNDFAITYKRLKQLLLISLLPNILNIILNILGINDNVFSFILAITSYTLVIQSKTKVPLVINVGIITSFLSGFIKIIAKTKTHCLAVHDFETSTMMTSSFLLGKFLEARSKKIANELLSTGVSSFMPSTAMKCASINGTEIVNVPAETLNYGDICFLSEGTKIPADGVVVDSYDCFVDESLLTGESTDVKKLNSDNCYAGSTVKAGSAYIRVTAFDSDTQIGRIASIVADNTITNKNILKSKVDKLTSIFFPLVSIWSFGITFLWYFVLKYGNIMNTSELASRGGAFLVATNFGLSSLLIACPCALSLAIPTAITIAVSIASRNKIILKDTNFLDKPKKLDTLVFDKTGTLTYGFQKVLGSHIQSTNFAETDIYHILFLVEACSINKLGQSLTTFAKEKVLSGNNWKLNAESVVQASNGIMADVLDINEVKYNVRIGTQTYFTEELTLCSSNEVVDEAYRKGFTVIFMTIDDALVNILVIGDSLKPDAYKTIQYLQQKGIEVYIASGDNEATIQSLAAELNIQKKNAKGSLKPDDKVDLVKLLQATGKGVVFCGDGFNDSPVLGQADLGISMASGVDLSLYSSSIIIHKLSDIAKVLELLSLLSNTINRNLVLSFFYNLVTIPVASGMFFRLGLVLNPLICSLIMAISSLSIMISSYSMFSEYKKNTQKLILQQ